jgi:hypothetical protein
LLSSIRALATGANYFLTLRCSEAVTAAHFVCAGIPIWPVGLAGIGIRLRSDHEKLTIVIRVTQIDVPDH